MLQYISECFDSDYFELLSEEKMLAEIFKLTFDIRRLYYVYQYCCNNKDISLAQCIVTNDLFKRKLAEKNTTPTTEQAIEIVHRLPEIENILIRRRNMFLYKLFGFDVYEDDGQHIIKFLGARVLYQPFNRFIKSLINIVNEYCDTKINADKWVYAFGFDNEFGTSTQYSWDCFGDFDITSVVVNTLSDFCCPPQENWNNFNQYGFLMRRQYESYAEIGFQLPYQRITKLRTTKPCSYSDNCVDRFLNSILNNYTEYQYTPSTKKQESTTHYSIIEDCVLEICDTTLYMRLIHFMIVGYDYEDNVPCEPFSQSYIDKYLQQLKKQLLVQRQVDKQSDMCFSLNSWYSNLIQSPCCNNVSCSFDIYEEIKNSAPEMLKLFSEKRETAIEYLISQYQEQQQLPETISELREMFKTQDVESILEYMIQNFLPYFKSAGDFYDFIEPVDDEDENYQSRFCFYDCDSWWGNWDYDTGYDVESLNELIDMLFYEDLSYYDDEDRLLLLRVIQDAINNGIIKSEIKFGKSLNSIIRKYHSATRSDAVKPPVKYDNSRQGIYTGNTGYNNTPTPADPIRNPEDIQRIKEYFLQSTNAFCGFRNYTIFCTGISSGLRASDLLSLKIGDIYDDGDVKDEVSIVEQKTHNTTRFHISAEMKQVLTQWLDVLKDYYDEYDESNYLFPSNNEIGHLKVTSLYSIFKEAQGKLNLSFHFSTHSLRKTFAYWTIRMHYYDQNIIFSLQDMLNHRDIKNTLYYSGYTKDHLRTLYDDMGKVLSGSVENAPAISTQEQKINQILEMLSKQIPEEHNNTDDTK